MPRRPPKEWFYYVVGELEKNPDIKNAKAVAAWLWYKFMKPESKRAVLKGEGKVLDPLRVRKGLIKTPKVLSYRDFKAGGLIRILTRQCDYFPEFALYPKSVLSQSVLLDAGFKEEDKGKWVLRTNKFSIFVYV